MALKVFDAGDYLMLSGDSQKEIKYALAIYESRGARVLSRAVAICALDSGMQRIPLQYPLSQTSVLHLGEQKNQGRPEQ